MWLTTEYVKIRNTKRPAYEEDEPQEETGEVSCSTTRKAC